MRQLFCFLSFVLIGAISFFCLGVYIGVILFFGLIIYKIEIVMINETRMLFHDSIIIHFVNVRSSM